MAAGLLGRDGLAVLAGGAGRPRRPRGGVGLRLRHRPRRRSPSSGTASASDLLRNRSRCRANQEGDGTIFKQVTRRAMEQPRQTDGVIETARRVPRLGPGTASAPAATIRSSAGQLVRSSPLRTDRVEGAWQRPDLGRGATLDGARQRPSGNLRRRARRRRGNDRLYGGNGNDDRRAPGNDRLGGAGRDYSRATPATTSCTGGRGRPLRVRPGRRRGHLRDYRRRPRPLDFSEFEFRGRDEVLGTPREVGAHVVRPRAEHQRERARAELGDFDSGDFIL